MSRPLRIQYPSAHYHVVARGNERRRIFWDDEDYERFCHLLEQTCKRFELRIFAFVLMTNHVHLMLTTPKGNLSAAMHWLKTSYSVQINRRRNRAGHLFQGRYYSVIIEDESHYLELSRYIHLNPVRAGMVKSPERYPWSSCGDYLGRKQRWPWVDREPLLRELGGAGRRRYEGYREFLYAGMKLKDEDLAAYRRGWVLGSDEFRSWLAEKFAPDEKGNVVGLKDIVEAGRLSCREARDRLVGELGRRLPHRADHRGTIMVALHRMGYPLREIGALYGVSFSAVSQHARRIQLDKKEEALLGTAMSNVKR